MIRTPDTIYDSRMMLDNDPEDRFIFTERKKKRKCCVGMTKCCGVFLLLIGLNTISFYIGYIVSNDSIHKIINGTTYSEYSEYL